MKTGIIITNDDETIIIEKKAENMTFKISNSDGQVMWLSERELRELKFMIDEALQIVNKRDWE